MADRSVSVSVTANVTGFVSQMRTAQQATRDFARRGAEFMRRHGQSMTDVGDKASLMGGAILAGVGMAIKSFADFDAQMSKVQAATHATSGEMTALRDAAVQAGASTAFSATEAAQAIEELSKAGVSTGDILNGGLSGALSLAAAGSLEVGEAAELAASAMTQFKLSGDQIPHIADLLAAGAGKAQGSVEDLGAALNQSGLIAAGYGLSIEETTGGLAAFASAGLTGSDAGTSFKTMLQTLTPQSKEAAKKMDELGFSAFDSQGNFKGLSAVADNLQQSMKDLTPEARNSAMALIFGSDAVRAANVLYEQGAAGIEKWTKSVNDAGYAALTASINQDNLKGDIEALGGSLDAVFLKSGSGANDALRGLVQGVEGLVDAVGQVPTPLLETGLGLTGLVGGATLAGGAFLSLAPRVIETVGNFRTLAAGAPRTTSALVGTAKAAGVAVAALAGLQIMGAITDQFRTGVPKLDKFNSALKDISPESLNPLFQGLSADVKGAGDAFAKLGDDSQKFNHDMGLLISNVPGLRQGIADVKASVDGMDDSLGTLTNNGGLDKAAVAFNLIAHEADESARAQGRAGMSAQSVLDMLPSYKTALQDQARQLGDSATETELLEMAQGKIPARLEAIAAASGKASEVQRIQKGVSEETAKALAEMGLAADGSVASLEKLIDGFARAGLIQLSQNEALRGYEKALDDFTESVAKNGATLDITTEAGRENSAALDGIANAGLKAMDSMAKNGATQQDLQGRLRTTYDALVNAAGQFGITGEKADELARSALGIPKNVPIETAIQNYADTMAKLSGVRQAADNLNGKRAAIIVDVQVNNGGALDPSQYAEVQRTLAPGGRAAFSRGGYVDGVGPRGVDSVPAVLAPGEYVIKADAAAAFGYDRLARINDGASTLEPAPMFVSAPPICVPQAAAPVNVAAPAVSVFIGNEQLDGRMYSVAQGAVDAGFRDASMRRRG